jgi:DNA mismatch repair protein MutS2
MSEQRFKEGDAVRVVTLKRDGVVQTLLGRERYRIAVGSLAITCTTNELTPAQSKSPSSQPSPQAKRPSPPPRPPQTLDLHGLTVDEAIRKLDSWLDAVILSELSHVKVVHGLGTGRVQRAVHERLQMFAAVKRFSINQWNAGETDVYL